MTNIYGLYDPRRPHVIMYVGKGMEGRARHHWKLFLAKGVTTNALLRAWFEKLRAAHIEPRWRFIEEGVPDAQWGNRERYWIAWWKERNPGLCNVAPGGNAWPRESSRLGGLIGGRKGGRTRAEWANKYPAQARAISRKGGRIGGRKGGRARAKWAKKYHEQASANGRKAGLIGTHNRWHIARDRLNPLCKLCVGTTRLTNE